MSEAFTYMITHIHSALAHFLHIRCVVYVCFSVRYENTDRKNRPFGLRYTHAPTSYQRGGYFGMFPMCIDTLALVSKHAGCMSLSCDVICVIAYCDRHESSHIIKAHADSARFEKKIICVNSWLIF